MEKFDVIKSCLIEVLLDNGSWISTIEDLEKAKNIDEIEKAILKVKDDEIYRKLLLCFNKYK